jgi:hypothetical protein
MHPSQYLVLNIKNYFRIAEEFVELDQLFNNDTLIKKLTIWFDMVIYPLSIIISIVYYGQNIGIFTVMTIHKAVSKWYEYIQYLQMKYDIDEWKTIVKSTGGPFISTNNDTYHAYVYADGMQRIYNRLFIINERSRLKIRSS